MHATTAPAVAMSTDTATVDTILAAGIDLDHQVHALLDPFGAACPTCHAPAGQPCRGTCEGLAHYTATMLHPFACMDCRAFTGEACHLWCPRFAD